MFSGLAITRIPILSSQAQYLDWSLEFKATAMMGGFHDALIGQNKTTSTEPSETDKVSQRELKAKGLILKTISQVLRRELMALHFTTTATSTTTDIPATAQQMWEHLKLKFKESGFRVLLDFKKLCHFNLVDDGTMEAQLNTLSNIRSTCALNDCPVEDWQFVSIILCALPNNYSNVTDSLLSTTNIKKLSIVDVKAKILYQEACNHNTSSSSNHLLLSGKPATNKNRNKTPPGSCHFCGEEGHWANRCPSKPRPSKTSSKIPSSSNWRAN